MQNKEAVVVDAARSPFGRAGEKGVLKDATYRELLLPVLRVLLERNHVNPAEIDDIILGSVGLSGSITNARSVVFEAGLPMSVPGVDLNRQCGSGLVSCAMAAHQIMADDGDLFIAGGIETMSQVDVLGSASKTSIDNPAPGAGPTPVRMATWAELLGPDIYNMLATAENLAKVNHIPRDLLDQWALRSHQKAISAQNAGFFAEEIVPITIRYSDGSDRSLDRDQCPRADTTLEKLASLKPVYAADGVTTAGNCCPKNDGAAACLIMSKDKARSLGCKPLVTFRNYTQIGVAPEIMGQGPVDAIRKLFKRTRMSISDFGLVEIHEAFSVVAVNAMQQLGINEDRLNVNGGAVAIGHPLGASGARLVSSLAREMVRRQVQWGLIGICCGGGQGVAAILELENYA